MTSTVEERPTLTVVEPVAEAVVAPVPEVPAELPEHPVKWALRAGTRVRARGRAWAARTFRPPDLVTQDQPSLAKIWRQATWGEHVSRDGVGRVFAILWAAVVAVPAAVFGGGWAWVHQKPARVVVAYGTAWALCQLPPVAAVIHWVAWLVTLPIRTIT